MTRYAENTNVSSAKSRMDIERVLERYGATGFLYASTDNQAVVAFTMQNRQIRFYLPMPDRSERRFQFTNHRSPRQRTHDQVMEVYEQAVKQKWRALYLVIKAKLEAVESGISEFEEEFLANIVLPDGQLAGDWLRPQIEIAYQHGDMPPLLAAPESPRSDGD